MKRASRARSFNGKTASRERRQLRSARGAGIGSGAASWTGSGAAAWGAGSGAGVVVVVVVRSVVTLRTVGWAGMGGVAWSPTLGRVAPSVTPVVITLLYVPSGPLSCLSVAVTVPLGFARGVTPVGGA